MTEMTYSTEADLGLKDLEAIRKEERFKRLETRVAALEVVVRMIARRTVPVNQKRKAKK